MMFFIRSWKKARFSINDEKLQRRAKEHIFVPLSTYDTVFIIAKCVPKTFEVNLIICLP